MTPGLRAARALVVVAAAGAAIFAIGRAADRRRRQDRLAPADALARVRDLYDAGAGRYDRAMEVLDHLVFGVGRRWVAGQASGEVLELAAGTGRNMPFYPSSARVTVQDISVRMLARARLRAIALRRDVRIQVGDAQALGFPDASFDTVVCTLGLCTIPDERRAGEEAWRVLRPGGRLCLLEHVRSPHAAIRLVQRALDPVACLFAGDHMLRDPLPVLERLGFQALHTERRALGAMHRLVLRKPEPALP